MANRSPIAPALTLEDLGRWCEHNVGSHPVATLFETGYLSQVVAFELADGREIVVKVRGRDHRLVGCHQVHAAVWEAGYPCPRPLTGPTDCGGFVASAEEHSPGGAIKLRHEARPELFAAALARLVEVSPPPDRVSTLDPSPPWAAWDHPGPGLWPAPDDRVVDLNAVDTDRWIDDVAVRVRRRLGQFAAPKVIGHGDWYSGNLRWAGDELHAVHDWDSVVAQPEAVIAGLAAAVFPGTGAPGEAATVEETSAFLEAYAAERLRRWSEDEREACWAAGLWVRGFDARKESSDGKILILTEEEAGERLRRAGA